MAKPPTNHERDVRLDNLTLARKEGWQRFVNTAARLPPESLTRKELKALGEEAFDDYNRQRREWHANIGPIKTPQLAALHEDLWDIVDSNVQDGDKAKGAVAIDAFPGLGKTTSVLAFAKKFHRREIKEQGTVTSAGHERWPVCRVGLTGNTGMVEFNRAMLAFFAHPGISRGNAAQYAHRALDCVLTCETRLLVVDDLHFLRWRNTVGVEISNHFKYIANEFPVTLIFVGVGLTARGLFSEGASYEDAVIAQTGRRTTRLDIRPFEIDTDEGRREWRQTPARVGAAHRAGRPKSRHARRGTLGLSVCPQHRTYRFADDADQLGLSTRRPYGRRMSQSRFDGPGEKRCGVGESPSRTGNGVYQPPPYHRG
jgi:AAA domain